MSKKSCSWDGITTCHDTVWEPTGWGAALLEKDLTSHWTTLTGRCQEHAPETMKANHIVS